MISTKFEHYLNGSINQLLINQIVISLLQGVIKNQRMRAVPCQNCARGTFTICTHHRNRKPRTSIIASRDKTGTAFEHQQQLVWPFI